LKDCKNILVNLSRCNQMDLKTFTAQIELMHQEALRQSASYEDKWLNTFHGGRESALDQVLKLLKGERRDG
ncbi:TPA: hypothetical protein LP862_002564, partial [Enterococcus faecium]|nr:hypothetical protein [Enterococcus faecium]